MNEDRRQILEMLAAGKITATKPSGCWPRLNRTPPQKRRECYRREDRRAKTAPK